MSLSDDALLATQALQRLRGLRADRADRLFRAELLHLRHRISLAEDELAAARAQVSIQCTQPGKEECQPFFAHIARAQQFWVENKDRQHCISLLARRMQRRRIGQP